MQLFLNGREAGEFKSRLSPMAVKIKRVLEASSDGELFTSQQLARLTGYQMGPIRQIAYMLPEYWHNTRPALKYWGKPATIKELKRQVKR